MQSRYKITCLDCEAEREVVITSSALGDTVDWLETPDLTNAPICSARKRLDGIWGWQCHCGNNDLMTKQERDHFSNPAAPKAKEIKEVMQNLTQQQPKFKMAVV